MKSVQISVDLKRREELRRLHTATHILNFSARKVLGNHVWQNGSNLKPEFGTLDITHYKQLSSEELFKIEKLANETIFANKKVSVEELDRTKAEKKYGFVLYQGGAIPMKNLRIVHVEESDIEACGGIHMQYTGGIGLIKIVESSKIQDGVVRLKYVVRNYAQDFISEQQKLLEESATIFSVDKNQLPKTCDKFFKEWKGQKKEIDELKQQLKSLYVKQITSSKETVFFFAENLDMGFLMEVFNTALLSKKSLLIKTLKFAIATPDNNIKDAKKEIPKGKFTVYIL